MRTKEKMYMMAYGLLAVLMSAIIGISIAYPQNRMIPGQMLLGTVLGTFLLIAVTILWNRLYSHLKKVAWLYWVCLFGFGIVLFCASIERLNSCDTFVDYTQIYRGGQDVADGMELPNNAYYFRCYSNNLKPMLFLSVLFRLADFLCVSRDYFVLTLSIVQVLLTAWACGWLLEKEGEHKWRFPILLAFIFFLPLWIMTSAFYTDTMSFGLAMLALACMKGAWKLLTASGTRRKQGCGFLVLLAAALTVLAIAWKITAITILIAYGIVLLLNGDKGQKRFLLPFLGLTVCFYCLLCIWTDSYELSREVKETENPLISWVALGMLDDGSWESARAFFYAVNAMQTKEEKNDFSMQYIRENAREAIQSDHIIKKLSYNYADGMMSTKEFLFVDNDDGTFLWHLFSPWGKYYWRACQYCFCYTSVLYVLFLLGSLQCMRLVWKRKQVPLLLMACQLAFCGMFLFMMVWEANNRQLYNQIPYMIVGAALSVELLLQIKKSS